MTEVRSYRSIKIANRAPPVFSMSSGYFQGRRVFIYMFPLREKVEVTPMMVNVAHIFGMP
jgi:hypothetical protein